MLFCLFIALFLNKLDVYFPVEKNIGLLPVPFHPRSPLRTLKVTVSLRINGCKAKMKRLNAILSDEKIKKNNLIAIVIFVICYQSMTDKIFEHSSLLSPLL